jgi:ubiquitin carboxyl-terminal hydrolase 25
MKRLKASKKLVAETKKLFATMLLSDKKYTDPSAVLHSIVDDFGNAIQIGEQKDIGEFSSTFLARIQEGLNAE